MKKLTNPRDFVLWLKGFLSGKDNLKSDDVDAVLEKIDDVDLEEPIQFPPNFPPLTDFPFLNTKPTDECPKCHMKFTDPMGRPIIMGYVCPQPDCPTGLGGPTFSTSTKPDIT